MLKYFWPIANILKYSVGRNNLQVYQVLQVFMFWFHGTFNIYIWWILRKAEY